MAATKAGPPTMPRSTLDPRIVKLGVAPDLMRRVGQRKINMSRQASKSCLAENPPTVHMRLGHIPARTANLQRETVRMARLVAVSERPKQRKRQSEERGAVLCSGQFTFVHVVGKEVVQQPSPTVCGGNRFEPHIWIFRNVASSRYGRFLAHWRPDGEIAAVSHSRRFTQEGNGHEIIGI